MLGISVHAHVTPLFPYLECILDQSLPVSWVQYLSVVSDLPSCLSCTVYQNSITVPNMQPYPVRPWKAWLMFSFLLNRNLPHWGTFVIIFRCRTGVCRLILVIAKNAIYCCFYLFQFLLRRSTFPQLLHVRPVSQSTWMLNDCKYVQLIIGMVVIISVQGPNSQTLS